MTYYIFTEDTLESALRDWQRQELETGQPLDRTDRQVNTVRQFLASEAVTRHAMRRTCHGVS